MLQHVIERERKGDYLGKTVQVVPHITDAIQDWIEDVAKVPVDGKEGSPDVCVIELGGTVGDIESSPFVEALRQGHPIPHASPLASSYSVSDLDSSSTQLLCCYMYRPCYYAVHALAAALNELPALLHTRVAVTQG